MSNQGLELRKQSNSKQLQVEFSKNQRLTTESVKCHASSMLTPKLEQILGPLIKLDQLLCNFSANQNHKLMQKMDILCWLISLKIYAKFLPSKMQLNKRKSSLAKYELHTSKCIKVTLFFIIIIIIASYYCCLRRHDDCCATK